MGSYFLYILRCADGTLYAGITTDLERRLGEHNSSRKGAKYTRSRRPARLVYSKKFRTRAAASKAEARVKKLSRAQKLELIKRKRGCAILESVTSEKNKACKTSRKCSARSAKPKKR